MARKPLKPSKVARNKRKQEQRLQPSQQQACNAAISVQMDQLKKAQQEARKALRHAREMGGHTARLVTGAMQAMHTSSKA